MSALDVIKKNPSLSRTFNPAHRQAEGFIQVGIEPSKGKMTGIKGSGSGGTINKNNGGGNGKNNTPAPPDPDVARPPSLGEWIFPPVGLWNMMFGKHDLQTGLPGAENPAYTQWKDQYLPTGGGNGGTKTSDPFSGALESMGTGLKLAGMAIPLMIGVMLLSQVKGLFK